MKKRAEEIQQINMRLEVSLLAAIDKRAQEMERAFGYAPTRTEIVRMALTRFLSDPESASRDKR